LAALAALFVGLRLFGLVGLFVGPVVAGLGIALYRKRRQDNPPPKTK
jgi:predicted PurR-regulated permease PerM